ncbi:SRPBCC family protein [Streptomyces sp. NBC_01808]|uniref:SRPBCC family protein n=1 Tax=Streptomyces sp. NBC_01808 TaxID=2975947 RepID=UPI002DD8C3C9|nr:SRPBCC family protein [Streptomyces sp. NBC_01808]WSA42691.1 SRPBCC family protein [Streptomyces sp. NBC_01808]
MELRHEFTVPVPADEAWRALLDIERIAPCMPGAAVESFDGETVRGTVKVKVGPITLTYRGTASFEEKDEAGRRMVLSANGKEARGTGTARATVTGELTETGGGTRVSVLTDLAVTGRPAQFGRGVLAEVGDRLVGRFAECLAGKLADGGAEAATHPDGDDAAADAVRGGGSGAGGEPASGPEPAEAAAPAAVPAVETAAPGTEPLDLVRTAGVPVAKRAAAGAAVAAALAAVALAVRRARRRR